MTAPRPVAKTHPPGEDGAVRGRDTEKSAAQHPGDVGERSNPSADETEECATAADAAQDHGLCLHPDSPGPRHIHPEPAAPHSGTLAASKVALEANAFLATILNGNSDSSKSMKGINMHQGHQLDSWQNYLYMHVRWIDAVPTPSPTPGAVVQ